MKKSIWFILPFICVLSIGCSKRWCVSHYSPGVDTVYKETVRDSIIVRDTTIYIHLPGETVIDSVIIPCPDPGPAYVPKRVTAETELARAEAWWSYPVIKLVLIQKDTTITKRLDQAIREKYYWKTLYEKITVRPEPVKFVPKFVKFLAWTGGMGLLLILAWLGFKIYKFLKPKL
jgi:hypothetical protein